MLWSEPASAALCLREVTAHCLLQVSTRQVTLQFGKEKCGLACTLREAAVVHLEVKRTGL